MSSTHIFIQQYDITWNSLYYAIKQTEFNASKMKRIRRWRIEILFVENFESLKIMIKSSSYLINLSYFITVNLSYFITINLSHDKKFIIKFMILSDSTSSTNDISLRHRRICFVFASLNFFYQVLQYDLIKFLLYCYVDVCVRNIQLHKSNWKLMIELWKF